MPTTDDFRKVARTVKRQLESDRLAFKVFRRERFIAELNAIAGLGPHAGEEKWEGLESAFFQEGLFFFPGLTEIDEDGFARVFQSDTRIARILLLINATRSPGRGGDDE